MARWHGEKAREGSDNWLLAVLTTGGEIEAAIGGWDRGGCRRGASRGRALDGVRGCRVLGEVELGSVILANKGGKPTREKLRTDTDGVDIPNGIGVASNNDRGVLVGWIRSVLRVGEDAHYIVPQAGELGAVMGVRKDLGPALGRCGQLEGLSDRGGEGGILRADCRVRAGGAGPDTGDLGLAGHGRVQ